MADQQGKKCKAHPKIGQACFCDEERDRKLKLHRYSSWDDGFGGYLCICGGGRFSAKYGCMSNGYEDLMERVTVNYVISESPQQRFIIGDKIKHFVNDDNSGQFEVKNAEGRLVGLHYFAFVEAYEWESDYVNQESENEKEIN